MNGPAPAGAEVGIYWDGRADMAVGDELVTDGTGRRYLVVAARQQTRGAHAGRWHLRCLVLAPDHPRDPDSRIHRVAWYRRARQPSTTQPRRS